MAARSLHHTLTGAATAIAGHPGTQIDAVDCAFRRLSNAAEITGVTLGEAVLEITPVTGSPLVLVTATAPIVQDEE